MCCKLWINYYPLKTHYNIVQKEHKYQWNVYKGSNSDVSWYLAYIWGSKVMQYTSVIVKEATDFMVLFKALVIIWNVPVSYRFILHDHPESPKVRPTAWWWLLKTATRSYFRYYHHTRTIHDLIRTTVPISTTSSRPMHDPYTIYTRPTQLIRPVLDIHPKSTRPCRTPVISRLFDYYLIAYHHLPIVKKVTCIYFFTTN